MFAGIRKRLTRKPNTDKDCDDDDKDDVQNITTPPNYIQIKQGKIQLVKQCSYSQEDETVCDTDKSDKQDLLEKRIHDVEGTLMHLRRELSESKCESPMFEKELRQQLENMNRLIKSKERKQMQVFRDHKALQLRFVRQENQLQALQQENRALIIRIRQYERCMDDVMRKVVDAIVTEDNLREEIINLQRRVRDLEVQNATLSGSPVKAPRDEGYCTMSSGGQPQPTNNCLGNLPEEPENDWLFPAEPCSTEMENWSMSQEEEFAVTAFDNEPHELQAFQQRKPLNQQQQQRLSGENDWLWNSSDILNSTTVETDDPVDELLRQKLVYSEDEDVACKDFTNDFYKLVNIRTNSTHSLFSYLESETDNDNEYVDDDDEEDDDDESDNESSLAAVSQVKTTLPSSPTPSEAGRAQVTSCSSSESDEEQLTTQNELPHMPTEAILSPTSSLGAGAVLHTKAQVISNPKHLIRSKSLLEDQRSHCQLPGSNGGYALSAAKSSDKVTASTSCSSTSARLQDFITQRPANSWRRSNGWKRVTATAQSKTIAPKSDLKLPMPKNCQVATKMPATRIPTTITAPQQQQQQANIPNSIQQKQVSVGKVQRKSKIPPPVPVRRSYAS